VRQIEGNEGRPYNYKFLHEAQGVRRRHALAWLWRDKQGARFRESPWSRL